MLIQPGRSYRVRDRLQRELGTLAVEAVTAGLIEGSFLPGPDYPAACDLFRAFEEAVDLQALPVVDRLDKEIAGLGLALSDDTDGSFPVGDVQIYGDGAMNCRAPAQARDVATRSPVSPAPPTMTMPSGGQPRRPSR